MKRTFVIWFCWVAAVVFFAWCSFWAPDADINDKAPTAPEFFLFLLGMVHMIGGAVLTAISLGDQADWLD